ncbi:polysaccharide biosynthesis C-terminal domain-containing protein [Gordonia sp. Swx-4]|uniref:lipopolysaccharide biosynthesis protein n=1 Tax=Gordonia sp. Swx-4 TaxID=3029399 RepID=UPI00257424A7|nr:polysaccharide biosynthesis C-terminal domain-containing protein [Gordonia sp. Swx-4]WJG14457.1 polysaccharide biosynthesis C-terminal domain-containing protein [Gordonia sp. Swx-4]
MTSQLIKTTGLYLLGTAGSKIVLASLIPIYAIWITPSDLGEFDFVQTAASILAPLVFVASWESVIRFAMGADRGRANRVIADLQWFAIVTGCSICVSAAVFYMLSNAEVAETILVVSTLLVAQGLAMLWQYSARSLSQRRLFAISGVVSAIVNVVLLLICCVLFDLGFVGLYVAYLISQIVIFTIIEVNCRFLAKVSFFRLPSLQSCGYLYRFSAPLVLNLIAMLAISGFGRLLITSRLGPEENGQYVLALKIGMLIAAVGSVLTMASIEETVSRIGSDSLSTFFGTMISGYWDVLLSLASLVIVFVWAMLPLLENTQYADAFNLVPAMVLFAVLSSMATTYGNAFQATLRMGAIAYTTMVAAAVCVGASLGLVEVWGATGVAAALCIGTLVLLLLRAVIAHRLIRFELPRRLPLTFGWFALVAILFLIRDSISSVVVIFTVALGLVGGMWQGFSALKRLRAISG